MLGKKRGKVGTLASLAAMILAAAVGFWVDAHTPSVAEASETRTEVAAVEERVSVVLGMDPIAEACASTRAEGAGEADGGAPRAAL